MGGYSNQDNHLTHLQRVPKILDDLFCNINGSTFSLIYCDLLATDQLRKSFSPLQAKGRISATLPKLLPFRGYQQLIPKNLQNKIFLKKRRFLQLLEFGRFLFLKYVRFSLENSLPC